ncbi:uncharacterized protein LACBIDRAFT_336197 [Laccaria bicolor S238N-H82]|uniref:Predicted protein n=1 Tax=Laccaria bicolor (strain S238N-H82 / ATCC MYA-4686) TaxID=486041 RepID=B0E4P8_LACBS|nr:uncharacterized protein LACBIDRAFT_336197 [Laccaria bicolor S238N-H82]EDQ98183.1 predicted protein [Laccaria bicolor S238N-H82]|eukprot:XP_001891166.1 predicted protein [Laccaria bicolor S238N-H82]
MISHSGIGGKSSNDPHSYFLTATLNTVFPITKRALSITAQMSSSTITTSQTLSLFSISLSETIIQAIGRSLPYVYTSTIINVSIPFFTSLALSLILLTSTIPHTQHQYLISRQLPHSIINKIHAAAKLAPKFGLAEFVIVRSLITFIVVSDDSPPHRSDLALCISDAESSVMTDQAAREATQSSGIAYPSAYQKDYDFSTPFLTPFFHDPPSSPYV